MITVKEKSTMTAAKHSANTVSDFMKHHFRHFNAAVVIDAAEAYVKHLSTGGKMLITLAGAMSTAELGLSLAEMIRQDKVHGICCTGANLEEDIYNLVAHNHYKRVPHYRHLSPKDEVDLLDHHLNRVTDTCIPEEEAMRRIRRVVIEEWYAADRTGQRFFPHEFLFKVLKAGKLEQYYQIDPKDSWMLAAAEKNLPMIVPWMGRFNACATCSPQQVIGRQGPKMPPPYAAAWRYMIELARWYTETATVTPLGFFQIGGGIAGDFPICVVPACFTRICGVRAFPYGPISAKSAIRPPAMAPIQAPCLNEKITWGKTEAWILREFVIESDATIEAPLIFAWVLGW